MLYWFVVRLQIIQNTLSNQRQVTWNTGLSNNIQWVSGVRKCAYKYITCKYGTKVKYTRTQWCTHSIFMPCDLPCEFNQDISVCELCNWSVYGAVNTIRFASFQSKPQYMYLDMQFHLVVCYLVHYDL